MLMNNFRDYYIIKICKYFSVSEVVLERYVMASPDILITKIRRNNNRLPFLEL
jgi:hypothetical protein